MFKHSTHLAPARLILQGHRRTASSPTPPPRPLLALHPPRPPPILKPNHPPVELPTLAKVSLVFPDHLPKLPLAQRGLRSPTTRRRRGSRRHPVVEGPGAPGVGQDHPGATAPEPPLLPIPSLPERPGAEVPVLHGPAAARAVFRALEDRPPADHALRRWGGPLPPAAAGRARGPPGPASGPAGLPVDRLARMVGSLTAVGNSMGPRPAASDLKSSELTTSGDRSPGKYSPKHRWKGWPRRPPPG